MMSTQQETNTEKKVKTSGETKRKEIFISLVAEKLGTAVKR